MSILKRKELESIPVFITAVEAGSFSRAADRLALTRSAVGKTIARLEERLGTRLFNRVANSVILTEEGKIYYEYCLRALEELSAGEVLLEQGKSEIRGNLKITLPMLFGRFCVAPILLDITQQNRGLNVELCFSDSVIDIIGEKFDLAIRNHTPGESERLSYKKITSQRKVMCASPKYLSQQGIPQRIDELVNYDVLLYCRNGVTHQWAFKGSQNNLSMHKLKNKLKSDNHEVLVEAAIKGMGIAYLPEWLIINHLSEGRLLPILEKWSIDNIPTYAVWPDSPYVPLRTTMVIDALVERLAHIR